MDAVRDMSRLDPHALRAAAARERPRPSNLDALRPQWAAHVAAVRREVPGVIVAGDGESLHLGPLSPGCRACKAGTWDCVFMWSACNLDCAFCCSPRDAAHAEPRSAFGAAREEIASAHARTRITGVSFSGGEPFLDAERLCDWLAWFKANCPRNYYWVYTNGVLADEAALRRLGALGLDEIRFNLAASGYRHPAVLRNVAAAARHIPRVAVEIPAIPEHAARVLESLAEWCKLGVRYLNLHELMYEPGSRSGELMGSGTEIVTPDGHRSEVHPESRAVSLAVMRRVLDDGLPLAVNDCSLQGKLRQLRGRRRSLAPLLLEPHERLVDDEYYECYCVFRDGADVHFFHPASLNEMRERYPAYQVARATRLAPLAVDEPARWIRFEPLE